MPAPAPYGCQRSASRTRPGSRTRATSVAASGCRRPRCSRRALLGLAVTLEALAELELQRREPALHHRVVVAVAAAAHAAGDAVRGERLSVVLARVGAALVGVMQQARVGAAPSQRLLERSTRQVPIVDRAHRPADDEPRVQVEDRREVQPAASGQRSSVVSPTQRWLGASASNSRASRFGAIGWSCSLIVVHRYRRRTRAFRPSCCISRMTRLRLTCSSWARGPRGRAGCRTSGGSRS